MHGVSVFFSALQYRGLPALRSEGVLAAQVAPSWVPSPFPIPLSLRYWVPWPWDAHGHAGVAEPGCEACRQPAVPRQHLQNLSNVRSGGGWRSRSLEVGQRERLGFWRAEGTRKGARGTPG